MRYEIIGGCLLLIFMVTAGYLMAKLGHPGAVWFWRDMLGVM
jgi:hypothetical protein